MKKTTSKLLMKITELESEIKKLKVEKKIIQKPYGHDMRSIDRKEVVFLVSVLACIIMYAFFALMIRGFL